MGPMTLAHPLSDWGDLAGHEQCASMEQERLRTRGSRRLSNSLEDLTFMLSQPIPGPVDYPTGASCELLPFGALPVISNGKSKNNQCINRFCGRCRRQPFVCLIRDHWPRRVHSSRENK